MNARRAVVSALAPRPSSPDARPQVPISFPLRLRPTPYIEQHGFRGANHFLLTCLVLVVPCVPASHGFHTSWPLYVFHTSKSLHYIRPARTGRPTQMWVDSICPTHVWILYIPATRGPSTSWPLYGFHTSKSHVDSIRPGYLDSVRPNQVWILYVPLIRDVPHVPLILSIPYVPPKRGFHIFSVHLWHLSPSVGP